MVFLRTLFRRPDDPEIEREFLRSLIERARHSVASNVIGVLLLFYACFTVDFSLALVVGLLLRLTAIANTSWNVKTIVRALDEDKDLKPSLDRFALGMAYAGATWGVLLWLIPADQFVSIQGSLTRLVVVTGVALVTLTASPVPRIAVIFASAFALVGGAALLHQAPVLGYLPLVVSGAILVAILHFGVGMSWQAQNAARMLVENRRMADVLQKLNVELGEALDAADRLARFDALTALPNRFSFDERCAAIHQFRKPEDRWHALVFDLDHFKTINDTVGHDGGDEVLRATGKAVAEMVGTLPDGAIAARVGGEEFALMIPALDRDGVLAIAGLLRDRIRHVPSPAGHGRPITASVGIASWHFGEPLHLAIKRADTALYAAKAAGRDRAHVEDEARAA